MTHEDEIHARPRRTWFESEREKVQAKKAGQEELNGRVGPARLKQGGKLSNKDRKSLDDKRERVEGRAWKKGKSNAKATKDRKGKDRGAKGGAGERRNAKTKGGSRRAVQHDGGKSR